MSTHPIVEVVEGQFEIANDFTAPAGWLIERVDTKRFSAYDTFPEAPALMMALTLRGVEAPHERRRMAFRVRVDLDSPTAVEAGWTRLREMGHAWLAREEWQ